MNWMSFRTEKDSTTNKLKHKVLSTKFKEQSLRNKAQDLLDLLKSVFRQYGLALRADYERRKFTRRFFISRRNTNRFPDGESFALLQNGLSRSVLERFC